MKSFKSSLLFGLFVAGVIAFTVYEFNKGKEEEVAKASENKMFLFSADEIKSIKLKQADRSMLLVKEGEQWKLSEPLADLVDEALMSNYLESLLSEKAKLMASHTAEKPVKWADYGLETPGTEWELVLKSGETHKWTLSRDGAFDGSFFIRRGEDLLLGERSWAALNERDPETLRDRKLILTPGDFRQVKLQHRWTTPATSLEVNWSDGTWTLKGKEKIEIDPTRLQSWTDQIRPIAVERWLQDSEVKDLAKLGLNRPYATIEFGLATPDSPNKMVKLEFGKGQAEGEFYVRSSDRPFIGKVARDFAEKTEVVLDDWREGRKPFDFNVENVARVKIMTAGLNYEFIKENSSWKIQPESPDKELDEGKLTELFGRLKSIQAKAFFAGKNVPSMNMNNMLQMSDQAGKPIFDLTWGGDFRVKSGLSKGESLVYVKRAHLDEFLGVSQGDLVNFPWAALTRAKAPIPGVDGPKK